MDHVYGRYRLMRMPFGIRSALGDFQRLLVESQETLQNVTFVIADDILIYGQSEAWCQSTETSTKKM